jgi:hypothetical protein
MSEYLRLQAHCAGNEEPDPVLAGVYNGIVRLNKERHCLAPPRCGHYPNRIATTPGRCSPPTPYTPPGPAGAAPAVDGRCLVPEIIEKIKRDLGLAFEKCSTYRHGIGTVIVLL